MARVPLASKPPLLAATFTVHTLRCDRCGGSFPPHELDAPPHGSRVIGADPPVTRLIYLTRFLICGGCLETHYGVLERVEPVVPVELGPERCPVCQRPAYFSYASAEEAATESPLCWARSTCRP